MKWKREGAGLVSECGRFRIKRLENLSGWWLTRDDIVMAGFAKVKRAAAYALHLQWDQ